MNNSSNFILFVTGISASGKTTLFEALKKEKNLNNFHFHDIDENGVPPVGRGPWRSFRVEELLFNAIINLEKGTSSIICGITKPSEIIDSKYYNPTKNIHFLLLDVELTTFIKRVNKRVDSQEKVGEFDEVFNPDALQELIIATKRLKQLLLNSTSSLLNGHILNVDKLTKPETLNSALKIINNINNELDK